MMSQKEPAAAIDNPTRTVLLVEDEPAVRGWIHIQLEESGYNLLEASDGAEALLIAELHHGDIDLIVTDVVMPHINGPELVKELLQLRPGVKVLYMSGYPELFLRNSSELPPGITYLQKPFPMTTLLDIMRVLLAGDVGQAFCSAINNSRNKCRSRLRHSWL